LSLQSRIADAYSFWDGSQIKVSDFWQKYDVYKTKYDKDKWALINELFGGYYMLFCQKDNKEAEEEEKKGEPRFDLFLITFYHGFNKSDGADFGYSKTQYVKVNIAPAFDGNNGKFVCFIPEIRESVAYPLL
jgi:hypothetical protein